MCNEKWSENHLFIQFLHRSQFASLTVDQWNKVSHIGECLWESIGRNQLADRKLNWEIGSRA